MKMSIYRCGICKEILSDQGAKEEIAVPHIHIKGLIELAHPRLHHYGTSPKYNWETKSLELLSEDQVHLTCLVAKLKRLYEESSNYEISKRITIEEKKA